MNVYNWYYIMNVSELRDSGLGSKTYTLTLENIGQKTILATLGNVLGITYDGIFLTPNLNEENPFEFEGMAAYIDGSNQVWLGFLQ